MKFTSFSLLLISLIISFYSCGPQPEELIQYYATGEVSRKHTEINGKKEGKMVEYYKDGKVKEERIFENDLQVGKTIVYYPSGAIQEAQYYEKGKLQGGDTVFYENGKPQFLRNFSLGRLDGYLRKWDTNDSLLFEAKYRNDTLIEVKGKAIHPDSMQHQ